MTGPEHRANDWRAGGPPTSHDLQTMMERACSMNGRGHGDAHARRPALAVQGERLTRRDGDTVRLLPWPRNSDEKAGRFTLPGLPSYASMVILAPKLREEYSQRPVRIVVSEDRLGWSLYGPT